MQAATCRSEEADHVCVFFCLRRKSQQTHRSALGSSALSSEDEDSFYDSNIASILNESHLQTSNCWTQQPGGIKRPIKRSSPLVSQKCTKSMKDSPVRGTELPCTANTPHEFFDTQIENFVQFLERSADCDCFSIILFQGVLFLLLRQHKEKHPG